jgi:hypothetical protein
MLSRLRQGKEEVDHLNELRLHPAVNVFCAALMRLEFWLIRCGLSLPVGGSLLVVARKKL